VNRRAEWMTTPAFNAGVEAAFHYPCRHQSCLPDPDDAVPSLMRGESIRDYQSTVVRGRHGRARFDITIIPRCDPLTAVRGAQPKAMRS